jgi:hypothetical protein
VVGSLAKKRSFLVARIRVSRIVEGKSWLILGRFSRSADFVVIAQESVRGRSIVSLRGQLNQLELWFDGDGVGVLAVRRKISLGLGRVALNEGVLEIVFLSLLFRDLLEENFVFVDKIGDLGFKSVDLGNSLLVELLEHHVLVREIIVALSATAAVVLGRGLIVGVDWGRWGVRDFSLDEGKEIHLSSLEEIVEVNVIWVHGSLLAEIVHIELSDERVHLIVLEVDWQDSLGELLNVLDDKEVAAVAPSDNVVVALFFQEFVSFANEWGDAFLR